MEWSCARTTRSDPPHHRTPRPHCRLPPPAPAPARPPGRDLGAAVYEVAWSASALQIVVLMGHFVGAILFFVNDWEAVTRSLIGFSLFVWGLAALYLIPTLVTCLTPAPFPEGSVSDRYLDAPGLDGGKPGPVADDG